MTGEGDKEYSLQLHNRYRGTETQCPVYPTKLSFRALLQEKLHIRILKELSKNLQDARGAAQCKDSMVADAWGSPADHALRSPTPQTETLIPPVPGGAGSGQRSPEPSLGWREHCTQGHMLTLMTHHRGKQKLASFPWLQITLKGHPGKGASWALGWATDEAFLPPLNRAASIPLFCTRTSCTSLP